MRPGVIHCSFNTLFGFIVYSFTGVISSKILFIVVWYMLYESSVSKLSRRLSQLVSCSLSLIFFMLVGFNFLVCIFWLCFIDVYVR